MNGADQKIGKRGKCLLGLICLALLGLVVMAVLTLGDRPSAPARGTSTMPGQAAAQQTIPANQ